MSARRFSEIPYDRPDLAALCARIDELTAQLHAASSYDEARAVFLAHDEQARHVDTLTNVAYIRHSIDTRDAFYTAENDFWDEAGPTLQEHENLWLRALLESPHRSSFEAEFGNVLFLNAELAERSFSPAIVDLLQQENKLSSSYARLIASAQIPFEGKTYTLSQLSPHKTCADDARRLAAWKAEGGWYKEQQVELDRIFDELVHVRDQAARTLGHASFVPLGLDRMQRNCYGLVEIQAFRDAVRSYVVPLATEIYRAQARRIGADFPLSYADAALTFRSGNPRPVGAANDILAAGRAFYDELSPETSRYFRAMLDRQLMDVLSTEGKESGGYCTTLLDEHMPFIFANFNGTQHDVEVITHEAGHGFEAYLNIDRVPMDYVWAGMEGSEVHSMSMEFFAWPWAERFFGDDADKYRYSHLAGAITFIPYGTMVDHFQQLVYEHPGWTPAERHACWRELMGVYMPWIRLDGDIPFYAEGQAWQRQHHIYESPFYYIDYCLAQTVALECWALDQRDHDDAWERYMTYTRQGGSDTFVAMLARAGLTSPFEESCLRDVCERAHAWLEAFDLSAIA
jgi:M3 family oligoendopeptidase